MDPVAMMTSTLGLLQNVHELIQPAGDSGLEIQVLRTLMVDVCCALEDVKAEMVSSPWVGQEKLAGLKRAMDTITASAEATRELFKWYTKKSKVMRVYHADEFITRCQAIRQGLLMGLQVLSAQTGVTNLHLAQRLLEAMLKVATAQLDMTQDVKDMQKVLQDLQVDELEELRRAHAQEKDAKEALHIQQAGDPEELQHEHTNSAKEMMHLQQLMQALELLWPQQALERRQSTPPLASFMCPITMDIMRDPVILVDSGHTFERSAIKQSLKFKHECPLTRRPVSNRDPLKPNYALRDAIQEWRRMRGDPELDSEEFAPAPRSGSTTGHQMTTGMRFTLPFSPETSTSQTLHAPGGSHVQASPAPSAGIASLITDEEDAAYRRTLLNRIKIDWTSIVIGRALGRGGFSTVYRGMWQGNAVAVKMLNLERLSSTAREEMCSEALLMCDLRHPRIASVYGLVDDGTHCALVMRYYKRGTVAQAIAKQEYAGLDMVQRLRMAQQVASGMCCLHDRGLLHGDLKTSNLLVEDDGCGVVITDFNLAGRAGQSVAHGALTVLISPPEVLVNPMAPRTQAGDVYAYSIVLLEIVTGLMAYRGMTASHVKHAVIAGRRPCIPDSVPSDLAAIITACWAQEPSVRPTFLDVRTMLEAALGRMGASGEVPDSDREDDTTRSGEPNYTLTDLTITQY